jgi:hypothetical protein
MTTQHDNPPRRRAGHRALYISLIVVLGLPLALYVTARIGWVGRVDRQIRAIKAAGLPTTPAELNTWYRLPAGVIENAADTYLAAFACYSKPNDVDADQVPWAGSADAPGRSERLSDQARQAISRFVAANNQCLDLLREAAEIPGCRYPLDIRKGSAAVVSWLPDIRKSVLLLSCEAVLHAEEGQAALAARSIETALAVGNSLLAEPTLVSQLARTGVRSAVISNLERVLTRAALTPEQLLAIDLGLAKGDDPNSSRPGLVGERVFSIDLMERGGGLDSMSSSAVQPMGLVSSAIYSGLGLLRRDEGEYLEIMGSRLKVLDVPESHRLAAIRAVDEQVRRIPATHIGTRILAGPLGPTGELDLRASARLRVARTALAIERYRLKLGRLPPDLNALVPECLASVPLDPFTGEAIRYRPLAKGYVVYSVGNDLSDEGGRERTVRKHGEPPVSYDITFIVER